MAAPLRIAIAGTGFIGAVHARSARLAGARLVGVSASSPERCFDLFVAEAHAVARGGTPPDGMPLFADGLRSAQIVDAVMTSASEERWIDVPAAASGAPPS